MSDPRGLRTRANICRRSAANTYDISQLALIRLATLTNIFADIPGSLPDELVQTLLTAANFRVERIVSRGHSSPAGFWYDQHESEWVLLVSGAARIDMEGQQPVTLGPGDFLNIPAHQRHRVDRTDPTQPTIWLAIHYRDAGEAI